MRGAGGGDIEGSGSGGINAAEDTGVRDNDIGIIVINGNEGCLRVRAIEEVDIRERESSLIREVKA